MNYDREALKARLTVEEGLRFQCYVDTVGKVTIGVGRNLTDVGITHDEAMIMLENDLDRCERDLDRTLPWWRDLNEVRQLVLMDMCFNMGIGGLLTFKNTLIDVKIGNYTTAAYLMLQSKWASQVGDRAVRLAKMMETGEAA